VGGELTSTQDLLLEWCSFLPEGTLLIADTQFKGRGRGTNLWSSNDGCLMFSFTSKFYDGQSLPCVQYLVSIALIEAVRDHIRDITGEHNCLPYLKIKWPNDIYYGEKKV
jgi:biotin--protein ligase